MAKLKITLVKSPISSLKDQQDTVKVGDAGLEQLLNLALDEHRAAHAQQALGLFVADGGKTARKSGGHHDGTAHAVGLELIGARGRDHAVLHQATARKRAQRSVDGTQRHARDLGDLALGGLFGRLDERVQDGELITRKCHRCVLSAPFGMFSIGS